MTHFDELKGEIKAGIEGKNSGIPMGFHRLNSNISIRKSTYYILGGFTGSGKTSLLDDAFVLNPLDHLIKNKPEEIDLHIIYFSMERKNFKLAKWICRKIFKDTGIVIPINRMMGWVEKKDRLTKNEHDLFLNTEEYISSIMEKVTIIEGPQHPTAIRKFVDEYAGRHGHLDLTDKYRPKYFPSHPNKITLVISDHVGLTKLETNLPSKKAAIDKSSEDKQRMRDLYGFSPIDVSQFNRDISNPLRLKKGNVEPMLEDFKNTGDILENADIVISLFDPYRYDVLDPSGYDLTKMRDEHGKKYRNLKILKNSYGLDDVRIGMAFQPEIGMFSEMPKLKDTTDLVYASIINNQYFL